LVDVDVALCGDLEERNAEFVGEGLATLCADGALLLPVALVADEDLVDAFGGVLLDVGEPGANVYRVLVLCSEVLYEQCSSSDVLLKLLSSVTS
jgi:hypothetical protein